VSGTTMNHCCEVFPKLIYDFKWFTLRPPGQDIQLMPCIPVGDIDYRLNFCPSCGADVRGIEINIDNERIA